MVPGSDDAAVEGQFHAEFWRAPAAIAAIGFDGIVLACNAAYGEILGVEPRELVGTDSVEVVCPAEVAEVVAESVVRIETDRTTETRPKPIQLRRGDGTTVWVQFDSALVEEGPGDPYVLATMTDVSVQVEIQESLDRSDSWFRTLLQHQSDIVTVIDFDGIVHYISPNCERLLGFRGRRADRYVRLRPTFIPTTSIVSREGMAAQLSARKRYATDRVPPTPSRRLAGCGSRQPDGNFPPSSASPAMIVNARDVSERRRAEAAAREAESRFRSAFATSPLGIAFADLNGRFTWVNHALAHTLGEPESKLLEMSLVDFSNGKDLTQELADMRRLLAGEIESFSSSSGTNTPKGGASGPALHFSLVRDADGRAGAAARPARRHHRAQTTRDAPRPTTRSTTR